MTPTLEAETPTAEAEAAAELEAAAASGQFDGSAETGMTQSEREASADFDAPAAQGNLAGGWEEIIGGNSPTESKVAIRGGAIQPVNAPRVLRKGTRHRVLMDVVVTGYGTDDTLDSNTGEVSSTKEVRKLKVVGAQFLNPEDYIAQADDGTDVAAEANA